MNLKQIKFESTIHVNTSMSNVEHEHTGCLVIGTVQRISRLGVWTCGYTDFHYYELYSYNEYVFECTRHLNIQRDPRLTRVATSHLLSGLCCILKKLPFLQQTR